MDRKKTKCFCLFQQFTVSTYVQYKILQMTGFEVRTTGIESDALPLPIRTFFVYLSYFRSMYKYDRSQHRYKQCDQMARMFVQYFTV